MSDAIAHAVEAAAKKVAVAVGDGIRKSVTNLLHSTGDNIERNVAAHVEHDTHAAHQLETAANKHIDIHQPHGGTDYPTTKGVAHRTVDEPGNLTPGGGRSLGHIDGDLKAISQRMKDAGYRDANGKLTDTAWNSDEARDLAAQRRDLLREGVERGDFSVPDGRIPTFYSGVSHTGVNNSDRAEAFAAVEENKATLIESTDGGSWLNDKLVWGVHDPIRLLEPKVEPTVGLPPRPEAQALWDRASARYATGVISRGQSPVAFVDGATDGGTYLRVERTILIGGSGDLDER